MIDNIGDVEVTDEMLGNICRQEEDKNKENIEQDAISMNLWIGELNKIICGLEADNKRLREENEWQPIETAPKDGEGIILTNCKSVVFGYYYDDLKVWIYLDYPDNYNVNYYEPTYWKPLPQPPKEFSQYENRT